MISNIYAIQRSIQQYKPRMFEFGDASKLAIDAARADFAIAGAEPATGSAEAGT